jgi:epoxyqueuosine reductase
VAVALGNIGDPAAVPKLTEALSDPAPLIRGHAAWALGKIDTPEARAAVERALVSEADPEVKDEMLAIL